MLLAAVDSPDAIADIERERQYRFGPLPQPAGKLLSSLKLKVLASRIRAESIHSQGDRVVIRLVPGLRFSDAQRQLSVLRQIEFGPTQPRYAPSRHLSESDWENVLSAVLAWMGSI